ncbi:DUF6350 family protein [Actinokineospora guangxiensis]|uniref:DUF6350 family protein n=1 Tax=Actinokineospora guangxiensis TaxID=1490288 RepID=A0ABW0EFJ6_9PSEU
MALLEEARRQTARTRVGDLATAALGPLVAGYTAIAAVFATVTALAPKAAFTADGVLLAAVPGWLAAHQVPLVIGGRELGVLPLLATLLVAALVGATARAVAARTSAMGPRETGWIGGAVVLGHAGAGLAAALVLDGPVEADPLAGFYYPALISAIACAVALAGRSGLLERVSARVDPAAVRGLRAGLLGTAALVLIGALVLLFGLVTSFGEVGALFTGGAGAGAGLLLLSVGYLPNAIVAAVGFAAGPGFGIGGVAVGPLEFAGGPLPAVPLLGALPSAAHGWWPALLLLPALAGALVGWVLREVDESPFARLRAVAVAAVVVAAAFAVLAGMAGGALAGGPFDPVDLRASGLSLALVGWIGLPGAAVAWFAGTHPVAAGLIGPEEAERPDSDEQAAPADDSDEPAEPAEPADGDEPDETAEPAESDEPAEPDVSDEDESPAADTGVASDTDAADRDR